MNRMELEDFHPQPSVLWALIPIGLTALFFLALACLWMVERAFA